MSQLDALLDALRAAPTLRGARCAGRWDIWDETDDPEIVEYAIHQCGACGCLTACKQWVDSLPRRKRPPGVVAGQINRGPEERERRQPGRPRKTAAS